VDQDEIFSTKFGELSFNDFPVFVFRFFPHSGQNPIQSQIFKTGKTLIVSNSVEYRSVAGLPEVNEHVLECSSFSNPFGTWCWHRWWSGNRFEVLIRLRRRFWSLGEHHPTAEYYEGSESKNQSEHCGNEKT